jgi:hypothetical protein
MTMDCERHREAILLLLYGEIEAAAHRDLERHLEACPGCRLALAGERRLVAILAERPAAEPSVDLLARCREDLARSLRQEAAPRPAARSLWARLGAPLRFSPVYGLALLAASFLAGWMTPEFGFAPRRDAGGAAQVAVPDPEAVVAGLRSLQLEPETGRVVLKYDTLNSASIEGSVDDPRIRSLLAATMRRSPNAGLRLDAVEALRGHADDTEVRAALLGAMREDGNPGVRLKALAALGGRAIEYSQVRDAIVQALFKDENPGMRVRAIDTLARSGGPETLPVMERLARPGGDPYMRVRSRAFLEQRYARNRP